MQNEQDTRKAPPQRPAQGRKRQRTHHHIANPHDPGQRPAVVVARARFSSPETFSVLKKLLLFCLMELIF
jgi:hypothetical protein